MDARSGRSEQARVRGKSLWLALIILLAVVSLNILSFHDFLQQGLLNGDSTYSQNYRFYLKSNLEGKGTKENPYLIQSVNDLELLSVYVNMGTKFEGVWFRQEVDLDFNDFGNWTPIGQYDSGNMFCGVYDGNGHSIQNITIDGYSLPKVSSDSGYANAGLFGVLGGTVCNLKIESGRISGFCIGSICSHGTKDAVIVNCYSQADMSATLRCGGIADNLGQGKIICCVSDVEMECENPNGIGGVCSYNASVYDCYSTVPPLSAEFIGNDYRTQETESMYLEIGETNLDRAKEIFPEELRDLPLAALELKSISISVSR